MTSSENTISPNKIQLLPPHIIDQIKAGEIIEKPANLVKELLENAVDAGPSHISLSIVNNGLDLLSIQDDGHGIPFLDLPYAFTRHATSKLLKFEDLYHLKTFGFRGEALPSIASISQIDCVSYDRRHQTAGKISYEGGNQTNLIELPYNEQKKGTTITVKNLFYNTPVRLKFIQSKTSELLAIKKIIWSFLLTAPHISFDIMLDHKNKYSFPKVSSENIEERILAILNFNKGKKVKAHPENFIRFHEEYDQYEITGFLNNPKHLSKSTHGHFIFVNNRYILDKTLHGITNKTLKHFWHQGEVQNYFLFIKVPTTKLDVNIHPRKTTVKFSSPSMVYSLISQSIKKAYQSIAILPSLNSTEDSINQNNIKNLEHSSQENVGDELQVAAYDKSHPQILSLTKNFLIISLEQSPHKYLLNLKKFLKTYFYKKFHQLISMDHDQRDENQIVPLLIAPPLSFPQTDDKRIFPFIKNFGIDIDRMDPEKVQLRSLPEFLYQFENHLLIIQEFLSFLNDHKKYKQLESLDVFFESHFNLELINLEKDILPLIEQLTKTSWTAMNTTKKEQNFNFLYPLDDNHLEKIFSRESL